MSLAEPLDAPPWESPEWQEAISQHPGLQSFFENLESFVELPGGVKQLREMILRLAVRGRLQTASSNDPPAAELVAQIRQHREKLITEKKIRRGKQPPPINPGEHTFSIPTEWEWIQFGELGDWGAGSTPRRGVARYYDGDIVWLKSGELNNGIVTDSVEKVTNAALDDCSLRLNQPGDVLIAMYGATIGKLAIAGVECTTNQAVCACTCFDGVFNEYLFLLLKAFKSHFIKKSSGAAQPNYSKEKIVRTAAPLPPLAEQRRIVSKVEGLMSLCDRLEDYRRERESVRERASRSVLASLTTAPRVGDQVSGQESLASAWQRLSDHFEVLLDQPESVPHLRQSILQLAVQGKLVPQDPSDEPARELIAEIANHKQELVGAKKIAKAKKLPRIETDEVPFHVPSGWEWIRLESVCEVITKGSSPKWQGVSYLENADGGIMFVTSENVGNYVMRKMDTPKYVEKKFNEMEPRSILKCEDILVNLVGASIGRSAMWDRDDIANINQAVGIVRLVPGCRTLIRMYLLHYLNSPTCIEIMLCNRVTTAQPNISLTNVKHFLIPTPPEAEQKRIVSKVSALLSQCDELSSRLHSRQSTTNALLTALIRLIMNKV